MNSVHLLYYLSKFFDRISFQDPFQHRFLPEKGTPFCFLATDFELSKIRRDPCHNNMMSMESNPRINPIKVHRQVEVYTLGH